MFPNTTGARDSRIWLGGGEEGVGVPAARPRRETRRASGEEVEDADAFVAPVRTVPTATGSWPSQIGAGATGSWPSQLGGDGDDEEQRQEEEEIGVAPGRSGNDAVVARRPSAPVSALPESWSSLFF
jgi:hypothetical protein